MCSNLDDIFFFFKVQGQTFIEVLSTLTERTIAWCIYLQTIHLIILKFFCETHFKSR